MNWESVFGEMLPLDIGTPRDAIWPVAVSRYLLPLDISHDVTTKVLRSCLQDKMYAIHDIED
jgi:hypothetical protein